MEAKIPSCTNTHTEQSFDTWETFFYSDEITLQVGVPVHRNLIISLLLWSSISDPHVTCFHGITATFTFRFSGGNECHSH